VWGGGGSGGHLADGASYDPAADAWEALPPFEPLAARGGHAVAWTGSELLIWGGGDDVVFGNGARFSPGTGWALLPRAPIGGLANSASAWTGEEWLVWGGRAGEGARFRP
ncbi:MAG: hypothetical protein ACRD03_03390, partial [Acidimicrobiales bacterium]